MEGESNGVLDDNGVVLTEHELEVLSALALNAGDRWLAYQLAGGDPSSPPGRLPLWLAPALVVLGAFVAIATFTSWWWVGGFGLVLMGLGGWLTCLST
jgi:hypothetical protein